MVHGTPDWAEIAPRKTIYSGIDLAEHACRLDSIVTFDRRGDVVWLDDFNDNINKWVQTSTGTGDSIALSTEQVRSGAFSAKLVTGSEDGSIARIQKVLPLPVSGKIGFEISFTIGPNVDYLEIAHLLWDGTAIYYSYVRFNPGAKTLALYDDSGAWITFATEVSVTAAIDLFNTMKLVIDTSTLKYVRFILNDVEYDISAYSYNTGAATAFRYLAVHLEVVGDGVGSAISHADDAIITQNEP